MMELALDEIELLAPRLAAVVCLALGEEDARLALLEDLHEHIEHAGRSEVVAKVGRARSGELAGRRRDRRQEAEEILDLLDGFQPAAHEVDLVAAIDLPRGERLDQARELPRPLPLAVVGLDERWKHRVLAGGALELG